jgi:hypothetical protein
MPNRNVRRVFLMFAIIFELFLCFASTLYLGVESISFKLVVFVLLLSIVGIVVRVNAIDRHEGETIFH